MSHRIKRPGPAARLGRRVDAAFTLLLLGVLGLGVLGVVAVGHVAGFGGEP